MGNEFFESAGRTIRQTCESIDDNFAVISPITAFRHSDKIMHDATAALLNADPIEAAHNLRREVDFCSLRKGLQNTKNDLAARAGLKALADGSSVTAVDERMRQAIRNPLKDEFLSKDPNLEERVFSGLKSDIHYNFLDTANRHPSLHQDVKRESLAHAAVFGKDAKFLALFDLAIADRGLESHDSLGIKLGFGEACQLLPYLKKSGESAANIVAIKNRIAQKLDSR